MLGFYPLSTHALSNLELPVTPIVPVPPTGGAGDGAAQGAEAGRRLSVHDKRRRKRIAAQMADKVRVFQAMLDGADLTPEIAAVARTVVMADPARQAEIARSIFAQFFPIDDAFRDSMWQDQRAQLGEVARRLQAHMRQRQQELADDDDEVMLVLSLW